MFFVFLLAENTFSEITELFKKVFSHFDALNNHKLQSPCKEKGAIENLNPRSLTLLLQRTDTTEN